MSQDGDRAHPERCDFTRRSSLGVGLAAVAAATLAGCGWKSRWWHRHGHAHGHWGGDPSEIKEHARHIVDRALRRVDAGDEQRREVDAVVASLVDRLHPLAVRHRANRDAMLAALTGDPVDRATLERTRAADLALLGEAYTELAAAMATVAEVLTPTQRIDLAHALRRRRHWH